MRRALTVAALAAVLLTACDRKGYYRKEGTSNPQGTPADRTGGAKNVPDGAGGGPKKPQPADQK
jgi:hypothetical protein